jgi:hypothetical protein
LIVVRARNPILIIHPILVASLAAVEVEVAVAGAIILLPLLLHQDRFQAKRN